MSVRGRGHVQVTFLLFLFLVTLPRVTNSVQHRGWNSKVTGGKRFPWNYKQCSREDEKCFYSYQCCQGLVCLQAGYSDGHCIKKTSLQTCDKSSDCPAGCACEVKGLSVDGFKGFCVAKIDSGPLSRGRHDNDNPLRAGLRSGAGGLNHVTRGRGTLENGTKETTMERVEEVEEEEVEKTKEQQLQQMIESMNNKLTKHPGNRRGQGPRKNFPPPRSVSYLSVRSLQQVPDNGDGEILLDEMLAAGFNPDPDSLTPQERYRLFCQWLRSAAKSSDEGAVNRGGSVEAEVETKGSGGVSGKANRGDSETRLGLPCRTSEDCRDADPLDRWQVCCAKVNILRQGVKVVCEKVTPITRCVD